MGVVIKSIKQLRDLRPDWYSKAANKKQRCGQSRDDNSGGSSLPLGSDIFLRRESICAACADDGCLLHRKGGQTRCWRRARMRSLLFDCPEKRWPKPTAEQVAAAMSKK